MTAPSRSPQSLTTRRWRPRCSTRVERTTAPTGSSGARRAWIPGQGQAGVEVQRGEPVGQLVELAGGDLDLVDLDRRGRSGRQRPVQHHGQAGQGPDRPTAGDDPGPGGGVTGQHGPDGLGPLQGDLGDRHPVGRASAARRCPARPAAGPCPRATLATSETWSMVPMPASRLPPPRSSPRTGSWPTQTPARWPRKHSRASSSPVSRVIGAARAPARGDREAWSRWRHHAGPRWPAPPPRRRRRRRRPPAAGAPCARPRRPGRPGRHRCGPPRSRGAGRSAAGAPGSEPSREASTTIRWNELLPRSKTATRTVGIGVTLPATAGWRNSLGVAVAYAGRGSE